MNGMSNGAAPASYSNGGAKHTLPAGEQNFRMSTEAYRAEHGLVVQGERVPAPLQTFESVGFPNNIMDEVLHRGLTQAWLAAAAHAAAAGLPPTCPCRARSEGALLV